MRATPPSLTLITDSRRYPEEMFLDTLHVALKCGVDAVLLREKGMSSAKLLAFASRLREVTSTYNAALYIHTQADVARAVGAEGVHVSAGDIINMPAIEGWLNNPEKTVSASCHSLEEMRLAEEHGADFLFLSPLFPTASHPGAAHLGASRFLDMASQCRLPVIALGGIDGDNCRELRGRRMAVISAILGANDPSEVTATLAAAASEV